MFLSIIKYRHRLLKYVREFIYFSKSKKVCLMGKKTFKTVGCMWYVIARERNGMPLESLRVVKEINLLCHVQDCTPWLGVSASIAPSISNLMAHGHARSLSTENVDSLGKVKKFSYMKS